MGATGASPIGSDIAYHFTGPVPDSMRADINVMSMWHCMDGGGLGHPLCVRLSRPSRESFERLRHDEGGKQLGKLQLSRISELSGHHES